MAKCVARGPRRDADLRVDVLDVGRDRLRRDEQALRDLLVREPRASSESTSTSRAVSPAGHSRRAGRAVAGGGEHGVDGVAVEPPALTSAPAQPLPSPAAAPRGTAAAPSSRGSRRQRQGSDPKREVGAGRPAGITRSVETFVMTRRDRPDGRSAGSPRACGRSGTDGGDALALERPQRTALVPDRVGDAEPAEIVHKARSPERGLIPRCHPETRAASAARLATPRE